MIIFVLFVIMLLCHIIFDIPWYALILALIGIFALGIAFIIIEAKISEKTAENIVKAKIIKEVDFYKKKHQYSGCSYSKNGRQDYFQYEEVLDHTKCTFLVEYKDGKNGSITCKKHSSLYNRLILKD